MTKNRFQNQVAVITGGARGIGFAAAQYLTAEGASVAIWDIDGAQLAANAISSSALGVPMDVKSESGVSQALVNTLEHFGKVDILITSAGVNGALAPISAYSFDEWKRVLDEHLNGTFLCCRALASHMIDNNYGRIVTMASAAGKTGVPHASAYTTAKAGIIAFTKSLGKELSKTNIRANVLTPGPIRTTFLDSLSQEQQSMMEAAIPVGKMGTVDECASLIAFMASEECSFSTGAVFDISGGLSPY